MVRMSQKFSRKTFSKIITCMCRKIAYIPVIFCKEKIYKNAKVVPLKLCGIYVANAYLYVYALN